MSIRTHARVFRGHLMTAMMIGSILLFTGCGSDPDRLPDQTIELNKPFAEWALGYEESSGNPFDVVAHAVFTHEGGESVCSLMFYDGDNTWKFRFTGTKPGVWNIETRGPGSLGGKKGTIRVEDHAQALPGFLTGEGRKWVWSGNGREMVPQLLMISKPGSYWSDAGEVDNQKLQATVREFIEESGFTGMHISGIAGMWFNIERYDTVDENKVPIGPQNPDPRTFLVLEELLKHTYAGEALVHIWLWGSDSFTYGWSSYSGPDGIGGAMSVADQRLNRYIAARLGPLPGWSMGYGYDLHVWTDADELQEWYDFLKGHLGGWPLLIGARADVYDAGNPRLMQSESLGLPREPLSSIYWEGDYIGHYDYRVGYSWYAEVIDHSPKPQLQEDRFRIREHPVFVNKDYTPEMTLRGLWHSTMAGGLGNIWGNLIPQRTFQESNPYDNQAPGLIQGASFTVDIKEAIKTWQTFWFEKGRFSYDLIRDNALTGDRTGDGFLRPSGGGDIQVCLRNEDHTFYVFYAENADTIRMDLRSLNGEQEILVIDTRLAYEEISYPPIRAGLYPDFKLPHASNWAVVVGQHP